MIIAIIVVMIIITLLLLRQTWHYTLKIKKVLRTASLGPNFNGSYKKGVYSMLQTQRFSCFIKKVFCKAFRSFPRNTLDGVEYQ